MSKTCKRRFWSSTGIAIVAVLAIGIAWNSLSVPTAKAVGGDGASSNVTLMDTNANGKIDRIEMDIANPNFATDQMVVNAGWAACLSVQYGGADVTISGTPSIPAGTDPAILTIDLSEADTDLVVNTDAVNTANEIEVIYTGGIIGACIDDGVDEDLNDMAGDTAAKDTEIDGAKPQISNIEYKDDDSDGKIDAMKVYFSETVDITSVLGANDLTLGATVGDFTGAAFGALATDLITSDSVSFVSVPLGTEATAMDTKENSGTIAISTQNLYSIVDEALTPRTNTTLGAQAQAVFVDAAAPQIKTATYQDTDADGKIDTFNLAFTETLSAASVLSQENLVLTAGDFLSAAFGSAGVDLVGAVSSVSVPLGTESIVIDTNSAGLAITTQDGVANFSLTDGTNENTTPKAEAQVTILDGAAPQIKEAAYQDVDLDGKVDTVSLDFSETLDAASVLSHENLVLTVGDFTSAAFGSAGVDLVGAVATVDITLGTEASVVDTYSSVAVSLTTQDGVANFSLTDGTNENTTPKAEAQILPFVDEAKPVIVSATPTDASSVQSRTNSVAYTFSEPMVADTWVEGTEFDSSPDSSGWSGTWSGSGNLIMTLTHAPFLCAQTYTVSFTPAQVTATYGLGSYDELNNASTAPIGATHTFTTMSCSSSGSSSSSTTTEEEDEEEVVVEEEEDTTTDEETTTEEEEEEITTPTTGEQTYSPVTGELEDISIVSAGDFIKSPYFSTVYYVTTELTRRPFMDAQTFFTYADSFDEIVTVTDATLTTLPLGSVMLPNPGVVLVKIQSDPKTYAVDEDNDLRWITSEAVAISLYGSNWASYIIDIEPTFFTKFGTGEMVTEASDITVSDEMKTREELQ